MKKLRVGVILIVLSWLPFAQAILYVARHNDELTSKGAASELRLIVWGVQIVIGLIGLWLVGELAAREIKNAGWRNAPGQIWKLFRAPDK